MENWGMSGNGQMWALAVAVPTLRALRGLCRLAWFDGGRQFRACALRSGIFKSLYSYNYNYCCPIKIGEGTKVWLN